jgi:LacI family transcriptional regulator
MDRHDDPSRVNGAAPERVTIQDVARYCGVAASTVSNAITGRRPVQPATRERILQAATDLGYRPSAIARALRLRRTWTVALITANLSVSLAPEVARGVEEVALANSCHVVICNTDFDLDRETLHIDLLLDKRVDGVITLASSLHDHNITRLREEQVPFVQIGRRHVEIDSHFVGIDNRVGIRTVVDHLWGLGHRRLAFIGGTAASSSVVREKIDTFRQVLTERGLAPTAVLETGFAFQDGYRAGARLLDGVASPPTAVVAVNDDAALGVLEAALERGLRVPEDLSIVGWDDSFPASLHRVRLTTLRQPAYQMGRAAATLLLEQLQTPPPLEPRHIIFPSQLIIRHTTAPPGTSREQRALSNEP